MKSDSLSGQEVCKIIDACAKRGVVKLKLGALELEFEPRPAPHPSPGTALPVVSPQVLAEQTQEQEKSLVKDEIDLRAQQLAELQITDPAAYEQLVVSGQIELDGEDLDGDSLDN